MKGKEGPLEPDFDELVALAAESPSRDELLWSRENELKLKHIRDRPRRELPMGVDSHDLKQSGWGVIFSRGADPRIEAELRPLLEWRRRQAGDLYKRIVYRPGDSGKTFLWARHGETAGVIKPKNLPYYLLIVGGPEEVPFEVQYMISINHAVGRIAFDRPEAYGRYARNVRDAEEIGGTRPRQVGVFSVEEDEETEILARHVTGPLAAEMPSGWSAATWCREEATRDRLGLLLGEVAPGLLLVGAHGDRYAAGDKDQEARQGAVRCHGGEFFYPEHLKSDARLDGQVVVCFTCYGAGTPVRDNFPEDPKKSVAIATRPFVARLPQALLEHGALAFLGHVDRGWTTSFAWYMREGDGWKEYTAADSLLDALKQLLSGERLGQSMRPLARRYTALSAFLADELESYDPHTATAADRGHLSLQWIAHNDARNLVVLGDPAVYVLGRRA